MLQQLSLLDVCVYIYIYPRESKMYLHMKTCTQTFTVALIKTVKKWKQCKYPTTDEWISKMWYIHILEYCSAIKRNEVLIHATTWMNLEKIMQSEISQTQKAMYCLIPFIWNIHIYSIFHIYSTPFIWTGKSTETKNRFVVARSHGEGGMERDCWWVWGFFWGQQKCSKID